MALVIAPPSAQAANDVWGRSQVRMVTVTFDGAYPAGGESFTPADVGMAEFFLVLAEATVSGALSGSHIAYDYAAKKLMVFPGTFTETVTADQSTLVARVLCIGI